MNAIANSAASRTVVTPSFCCLRRRRGAVGRQAKPSGVNSIQNAGRFNESAIEEGTCNESDYISRRSGHTHY